MVLQALLELRVGRRINEPWKCLQDLVLGIVDVLEPMLEQVRKGLNAFCEQAHGMSPAIYGFTSARGEKAGPLSAVPSGANCEPWQGQSQQRSKLFQCTWQPRCVHVAERRKSFPRSSR